MKLDQAREAVQQVLTKTRYDHTLRVVDTAVILAERYGESMERVMLAAMLHDYAKCFSKEELKNSIKLYELPAELLQYHVELWHGPVGAKIAEHEMNIKDKEILDAIRYHTTGHVTMSRIAKIIFVADYTEPGRTFPGAEEVRGIAKVDLEAATRKALQLTMLYLLQMDATIHPDSLLAYNMLTDVKKGAINH